MRFFVATFQVTHTPISTFEKLAVSFSSQSAAAVFFQKAFGDPAEILVLATCNRFEIFLACEDQFVTDDEGPFELFLEKLASAIELPCTSITDACLTYKDNEALHHLFKTVAGLNSIAIGETQIQGQIKDAFVQARDAGQIGPLLIPIFESALKAGKHARHATGIDRARISLGQFAIDAIQGEAGLGPNSKVVILGTGKMAKNAATHVLGLGVTDITFLSSNPDKWQESLARYSTRVLPISSLPDLIPTADLIFSAYGTRKVFLTKKELEEKIKPHKPLYIIDIALPHDIDPAVQEIKNVHHVDIVSLKKREQKSDFIQVEQVKDAYAIIEDEMAQFIAERRIRYASSVISNFRRKAETIRQNEMEKAFRRLKPLDEQEKDVIQKLTYDIVSKILRQPTLTVKQKAKAGTLDAAYSRVLHEVFQEDER